jgi:hypothetical protein
MANLLADSALRWTPCISQYASAALCTILSNKLTTKVLSGRHRIISIIECETLSSEIGQPLTVLQYKSIAEKLKKKSDPETETHVTERRQLRWSRGCVLASSTQVRGFKPGRSCRIFQDEKIPCTPSLGGEVKPAVPCRRFAACKRTLNVTWKSEFGQYSRLHFLAH